MTIAEALQQLDASTARAAAAVEAFKRAAPCTYYGPPSRLVH